MKSISGMSVAEIIDGFGDIADLLIEHNIVGFKQLNPTVEEQQEIVNQVFAHGLVAGREITTVYEDVDKIVNETFLNKSTVRDFVRGNWHQDNTDEKRVPAYLSLHMTTYKCPGSEVGNTVYVDLEELYKRCPAEILEYLTTVNVRHVSKNTEPDGTVGSAFRTHPVTGVTSLYYSSPEMIPEKGMTPEFEGYLTWLSEQTNDLDNQQMWQWDQGDLVIWDNRNQIHSITGGWEIGDRIFNRCLTGDEMPFYRDTPAGEGIRPTQEHV